jgi:hypothetical protein
MRMVDDPIPRPPRLRPSWTTWMWVALIVAAVVFSLIGFWPNDVR